jgi:hypothetical protein
MSYIDVALRRLVTERAGSCCEYCLLDQQDSPFSFHIEHIISEKHGGETRAEYLCLSCPECNAFKGSDIGSIDRETGLLTPLFNPRTQSWSDHFRLEGTQIIALSAEGRVTTFLLRLNSVERTAERTLLIQLNRYPGKNRKSP